MTQLTIRQSESPGYDFVGFFGITALSMFVVVKMVGSKCSFQRCFVVFHPYVEK